MADGRTLGEAWRAIDDLKAERERYVRKDVYQAERDDDRRRIDRLEDHDKTQTAGGKAWLLGIGLAVLGAALGWLAQIMQARGGH